MKFQYVGNGNEDPVTTNYFGHEFRLNGESVDVTDKEVLKKISGNPAFKLSEEKSDDLEALKKEATEKGISFHPAIGYAKLKAKIDEAGK